MNDSRSTPPRQHPGAVTDILSGPAPQIPNGLWHDLARWSLRHPKLCTTLAMLGLLAFGAWNVWAAFRSGHGGTNRNMDPSVLDDLGDRMAVMLTGLLAWGFLGTVVVKGRLGSMKWSRWNSRSFNARVRERILRGVPIRNSALLGYAFFGIIGLALGLAQIKQVLPLLPWLGPSSAKLWDRSMWASVLAVFTLGSAARLLWQILIQAEWDYVVGDRRAEVAEKFLQDEEDLREAERETDKTAVGAWSYAVLLTGFLGGVWLCGRLPEAEQNLCISAGLTGVVAAGLAVYVTGTKPRRSAAWLVSVALFSAGALLYLWQAFDHPTARSLLLGLTAGVLVGGLCGLLYLHRIRRHWDPT
jgi:hypothetical protein